ncbi:hypothetical protein K439DRAFT_1641215, partial [Ramaria rubella]
MIYHHYDCSARGKQSVINAPFVRGEHYSVLPALNPLHLMQHCTAALSESSLPYRTSPGS